MVIFERPLLDRGDLLDVLDVVPGRAAATFRWLRAKSCLSNGTRIVPRRGNRLDGSAIVYSSLNWDALRAARASEWGLAREIAAEANALESEHLSQWVRALGAWLNQHPHEVEPPLAPQIDLWHPGHARERWARGALRLAVDEAADVLSFVASATEATVAVRQRMADRLPPAGNTLCRVWRIGDSVAELRALEPGVQTSHPFIAEELFAAGLRLGDAVSVRREVIAPGVAITTLDPAIELGRRSAATLTGRSLPDHLGALLEESDLGVRAPHPPPIRRVA